MITDDKIRDEILQYDINTKAAKILPLSSGKFDNYKYFADKEILSFDQSRITKQARFAYSHLKKALEKQQKLKMQLKKQLKIELKNKSQAQIKN